MQFPVFAALLISVALLAPSCATAQAPARRDLRPLEREAPVCSLPGTDVAVAVAWMAEQLTRQGFVVSSQSVEAGEVRASRPDNAGEDRAIAWVERSLLEPQARFNVYLTAGYFSKFFGTTEWPRLLLDSQEETRRYGPVRQALINGASKR